MKKLLVLSALLLSSTVFAGQFTGKKPTTCQILQNGKVIKKSSCTYGGYVDEQNWSLFYGFTIKGYPKEINTYMIRDEGSSFEKMTFHFEMDKMGNKKPAIPLFRDPKTLKIIDNPKDPDKTLNCVQQKRSKFEICVPTKDVFMLGQ